MLDDALIRRGGDEVPPGTFHGGDEVPPGASNYTYAEATRTQQSEDWIASHVRTFEFLGGATGVLVPDQLKSGVTKACHYEPGVQRTYDELAQHYGTVVIPARPCKPKDKAKVEVAEEVAVSDAAAAAKWDQGKRTKALEAVESGTARNLAQAGKKFDMEKERRAEAKRARDGTKRGGVIKTLSSVAGKYRCVYLDPPWKYGDEGNRGVARNHYGTMDPEELCALPVGDLAHKDGCHFWCWITWPKLYDGIVHQVFEAWGLRWVGVIVWNKQRMGTGHWLRSQTEVLALGVRGKKRLLRDDVPNYIEAKAGRHSQKPAEMYSLLESLSPGPRIELFSRMPRKGWDRWGKEA